ncbi:rhodanese-like domain-containing protein [Thioalkalivibrio sp.]|uniref:rhodanese-like domain-containing protein n=1 Tax=Thioalkalivibrio sp. TaxID=2093813 RepID=UPI00397640D5
MSRKFFVSLIILGILLLVAAVLFIQSQRPGAGTTADRVQVVARSIARGEDRVQVPELADRIIQDQRDFVLVDVRPAEAFEVEHIPGARNMPLTEITQPTTAGSVAGGRTLVLYDAGTTEAAQAATLLRVAGIDAQSLQGGFRDWLRYTLDPDSELEDTAEPVSPAERAAIACYFHGDYLPTAGIPVQTSPSAAYTPDLAPVEPTAPATQETPAAEDPLGLGVGLGVGTAAPEGAPDTGTDDALGLGLGLGVGTVAPPAATSPPQTDSLGLGLGLGVGSGVAPPEAPATSVPDPAAPPARRPGLRIGEGC